MPEFPHLLVKNVLEEAQIGYDKAEDPVYVLTNLTDLSRLSKWEGADDTPQHVTFTFDVPGVDADTFILDRNFNIPGGSGRHLYVQHSANGVDWNDTVVDLNNAALAEVDYIHWKTFTKVENKPYWRLRFIGLTGPPEIYNVWLGERLELPVGPAGDFDPYEEQSQDQLNQNPLGGTQNLHYFSRRILSAWFRNLTDAQMAYFQSWWSNAGKLGKPWWWLTYPTTYVSYPYEDDYQPLYLISAGARRSFPFNRAARGGSIEGIEVR